MKGGGKVQAKGGEDVLLQQLAELGLQCDPLTQLVVTCEVCRRPSTKECWTCGMKICDFCTLKRHWTVGSVPRVPIRSSRSRISFLHYSYTRKRHWTMGTGPRVPIHSPR